MSSFTLQTSKSPLYVTSTSLWFEIHAVREFREGFSLDLDVLSKECDLGGAYPIFHVLYA